MLYLLVGDDTYAIKRRVQALIPPQAERHYLEHNTADDLERLLSLAESLPLMGQRYVWCRTQLQKPLETAAVESLRAAAQSDRTVLILSSKSIDRRLRNTKALLTFATVETYPLLAEWDTKALFNQAESFAQAIGLTLDAQVLGLLVERVGNQTEHLASELEKLWLWHDYTQQPITPDIIERLVSRTAESSVVLSKHLLASSLGDALTCLQALLDRNEAAEKIIRTLDTQYRTWARAKALLAANAANEAIAKTLGLGNPNRVYFLRRELQTVSLPRLEQARADILAAELALKQGATRSLHTLVLKLAA